MAESNKSNDFARQYLLKCIESNDNMDISEESLEDDIFMNKQTKELLTVISRKDNSTLDLSVAQPCKYKNQTYSMLGTGIAAYKMNAYSILKSLIADDEMILKIEVGMNTNRILALTSSKQKDLLREVYNTMSEEAKQSIKSDSDFVDYVCRKSKQRFNVVYGMITLGKPIYVGSAITDYMDTAFVLKDDSLIISAEEYSIINKN